MVESDPLATNWPLVGRSAVLADIAAGLRGGGVVLAGPAGVGKTRLAREAMAHARGDGRDTEWLAATRESTTIRFGTVAPLLAQDEPLGTTPAELIRRTAGRMAARAEELPVVVGLDDAHLLDKWSASMIHQLTVRGLVSLLATVRSGEPAPDAITALWKDGVVRRMRVRPLGSSAINDLLERSLGPEIEGVTRCRLRDLAAGNPLLLRELLIGAYEDGALVRREGVWILDRTPSRGTGLVELVETRLRTLDGATRVVVEVVACGEPLPATELDRVAAAVPFPPGAVEAAERTGLVVCERSGRRRVLRMAHPLHGEVVRGILTETRGRKIWGWLARGRYGQPQRRRDDALRLARYQLEAGAATPPEELLDAARQATERVDLTLAARLVEGAQDAEAGPLSDRFQARPPDPNGPDGPAAADGQTPGETTTYADLPRSRGAAMRALSLYWGSTGAMGSAESSGSGRSRASAEVTPSSADNEPPSKAPQITARREDCALPNVLRAWTLLSEARFRDALESIPFDVTAPDRRDRTARYARPVVVLASAFLGRLDNALAVAGSPAAPSGTKDGSVRWGPTLLGWSRCLALQLAGRLDEAVAMAEEGYAAAVAQGAREVALGWAGFRGGLTKAQGRVVTAQAAFREAVAALAGRDAFQLTRHLLADLAGAAALSGDTTIAARWMERADELRDGSNQMCDPFIELNRAWVMAANGDGTEAAKQAQHAAALANAVEQYPVEAIALYDTARLGEARTVVRRLTELAETVDGRLVPTLGMAATALAGSDGEALDQATTALHDLGFLLHAAETAAAAGHAHLAAGDPARASAARTRMMVLLDSCEGAATPLVKIDRDSTIAALSRREREIAVLAAAGLSSRVIAERLMLSARTVDNHLGRAYAKLGVTNRAGLTALLGRMNGGRPARG
ncbi:MAG TPA: LuxR C-terminal-related transcriptional regulator [Streptosporangiaceae bacterium]